MQTNRPLVLGFGSPLRSFGTDLSFEEKEEYEKAPAGVKMKGKRTGKHSNTQKCHLEYLWNLFSVGAVDIRLCDGSHVEQFTVGGETVKTQQSSKTQWLGSYSQKLGEFNDQNYEFSEFEIKAIC